MKKKNPREEYRKAKEECRKSFFDLVDKAIDEIFKKLEVK